MTLGKREPALEEGVDGFHHYAHAHHQYHQQSLNHYHAQQHQQTHPSQVQPEAPDLTLPPLGQPRSGCEAGIAAQQQQHYNALAPQLFSSPGFGPAASSSLRGGAVQQQNHYRKGGYDTNDDNRRQHSHQQHEGGGLQRGDGGAFRSLHTHKRPRHIGAEELPLGVMDVRDDGVLGGAVRGGLGPVGLRSGDGTPWRREDSMVIAADGGISSNLRLESSSGGVSGGMRDLGGEVGEGGMGLGGHTAQQSLQTLAAVAAAAGKRKLRRGPDGKFEPRTNILARDQVRHPLLASLSFWSTPCTHSS